MLKNMNKQTIFYNNKIKELVMQSDPSARVVLFGSRARGDERPDSDWDVLIIVNQDRADFATFMKVGNPLYDFADENGIEINPVIFTKKQWENAKPSLFKHHILEEGVIL